MVQYTQINKHNRAHKQNEEYTSHNYLMDADKIQHPFMTKALKKLGTKGSYPNTIKAIFNKLIANIILNGENQ
jgi:ribosomal protein L22